MQVEREKKFFSILLSICLIIQMSIGVVFSEGGTPKYTSFEIQADKENISVPVGTSEEEVKAQLPMKINGTIEETATTTGAALNVEINIDRWLCDGFSSETPGEEFAFTGIPVWPYVLADGTKYPTIKVKIAGELMLPDGMTLEEGATYGGDISHRRLSFTGGLPNKKMQYKAGDGYVVFIPASSGKNATLELNNASIEQASPRPFDLPEIELDMLFKGRTTLYGELPQNANITLEPNAEFELKKTYAAGDSLMYMLANKMIIGENAKLIIDEKVGFFIQERASDNSSLIDCRGSIIVRGGLIFESPSYEVDIPNMNISTEGRGSVILAGKEINPQNGRLAFDENEGLGLSAVNGGEYSCGNGFIKWDPIIDARGEVISGTITIDNADIKIKNDEIRRPAISLEGADVPITLNIIGDNKLENPYEDGIYINKLNLTGSGNLTVKAKAPIVYETEFNMESFTGNLNALVIKFQQHPNGDLRYSKTYGNVSFVCDEYYKEFTVNEGSKLTIESGALLDAEEFTNHGEVINNGTLRLRRYVSDEEKKNWVYGHLNLKGNGIVSVFDSNIEVLFTNEGKLINNIYEPLDFSTVTEDKGELAKDGYHWDNASKTLTLENLVMAGMTGTENTDAITLPEGENVTLILKGFNKIEGFKSSIAQGTIDYDFRTGEASRALTIKGDGLLTAIPSTSNISTTKVLTTTGKLVMQSGTLIMKGEAKRGIDAAGIEIKGGTIGSDSISATINSYGDFLMSDGKVVIGKGDGGSLVVLGDIDIRGGELTTLDEYNGIMIQEGNFSMTGGKLTIHNSGNRESTGITMSAMRGEPKKFSTNGGILNIKSGTAAIMMMGLAEDEEVFLFESPGMNISTFPKGGTLKSMFLQMPGGMPPVPMAKLKVYSLTADSELKMEMGMRGPSVKNACKEINIAKKVVDPSNPTNPTNPSDGGSTGGNTSGGGSSSGGSSGGSSSGGSSGTTNPVTKPEVSTKPNEVVNPSVTEKAVNTATPKSEVKFTDIENHWAKSDIEFVSQRGLFGGTGENEFSPDTKMTRGMFVTVLGRLAKADVSSYEESKFKDVNKDMYYMKYIEWANKNKIVSGLSEESFGADQAITREQMAVMIVNYIKFAGIELPKGKAKIDFTDENEISEYAKLAIEEMQKSGLISGKEGNRFDSKGLATRAEVSAVLKRLIELLESK